MIVKIENIAAELKDNITLTEQCYSILHKDFNSAEDAVKVKNEYRHQSHYIVVQYFE